MINNTIFSGQAMWFGLMRRPSFSFVHQISPPVVDEVTRVRSVVSHTFVHHLHRETTLVQLRMLSHFTHSTTTNTNQPNQSKPQQAKKVDGRAKEEFLSFLRAFLGFVCSCGVVCCVVLRAFRVQIFPFLCIRYAIFCT
jgi:hypothetical protein